MNAASDEGTAAAEETVLVRREGRAGHIVLNRPRAINALTHEMIRQFDRALTRWERDDAVSVVVVTGAGERGLCAGGDIRAIYEEARSGGSASADFWRDEYRLNARIARFPKPYVAIMDGIVMGGGVGISAHGSVRVVTERSRIAMPETGIGFVPDVGGTYLLGLAPGGLGTHLALTGSPIGAGDALLCGLADLFVPSSRLEAFVAALADLDVAEAVHQYAGPISEGDLVAHRDWIDACYSAETVEEILERLRDSGEPEAKAAAERISANSPTAVKTTLEALRRARRLGPLEQVLDQEYRVSCAALTSPDLVEGIRAQVVDKDRAPRWNPPTLAEVTPRIVERFFAPLGARELGLGSTTTPQERW
jgi:enoyl-CoA hydratase